MRLRKMAMNGGLPINTARMETFVGGAWASDGTIYVVTDIASRFANLPAKGENRRNV